MRIDKELSTRLNDLGYKGKFRTLLFDHGGLPIGALDNRNNVLYFKDETILKLKDRSKYRPSTKIDLNHLISSTNSTMFKRTVKERVSAIGDFKYLGYNEITVDNRLYVMLNFEATSAPHSTPSKSKATKKTKSKKYKRYKYNLSIKFPFVHNMNKMKKMLNLPIELFSSDPSFKYYFAYVLNSKDAVIRNHIYDNWLGEALTSKPKIRNKNEKMELTKHFYKVVKFIKSQEVRKYLSKRYILRDVPIPKGIKL